MTRATGDLGRTDGEPVDFDSIPALIAPAWLVSRALPNRPALTGALCGLGVGVMADAGLRDGH